MSDLPKIDIRPDHWEIVRSILEKHASQYDVWAFGSRAKWTAKEYSDLDLAVISDKPLPLKVRASLCDDFMESDLPWKVDVVDWATTSESFRKIIERNKVVVQKTKKRCVMDEWQYIQLGKACSKIGSGATPRGGKNAYLGGDTALIRSQNIYNNHFVREGLAYINDTQAHELRNVTVEKNDVLLNITGDSVARCCQVAPDVLPARVNQHVAIIRTCPDVLDARFLRYVLISPAMQSHLLVLASAGATRNALTKAMIEALDVPVPPLPEQRAIAHILGTLDDKIELNRRQSETLQEMARALFKAWFVDFEPVRAKQQGRWQRGQSLPGLPAHLWDLFPERLVETKSGEVPQGWEIGCISDLCLSISSGGTPARKNSAYWENGTIPWFKTGELLDAPLMDSEEFITEAALEGSSAKLWPAGTILFALYASPTVGRLGVLTQPSTSNQAAAGLIAKPEYGVSFLMRVLLAARKELQHIAVGAAQQNINQGVLKSHKIIIPPQELAAAYCSNVEPFDEQITKNVQESKNLAQLRDTLLPQLLSGALRVSDAEKFLQERGL